MSIPADESAAYPVFTGDQLARLAVSASPAMACRYPP
jgi:hypothetical protein